MMKPASENNGSGICKTCRGQKTLLVGTVLKPCAACGGTGKEGFRTK